MIGKRLSDLRKDREMTQQELADLLHLTKYNISAYERGANEPPDEIKIAIANHFQVSIDYLLGLTDCPNVYEKPGSFIRIDNELPADLEYIMNCVKNFLAIAVAANPEVALQEIDSLIKKIDSTQTSSARKKK